MSLNLDKTIKAAHSAEAVSGSSWGYVAIGLAVCALVMPTLIAYVVFPAALACTIVAVRKKAPAANWAVWPLVAAGLGLAYSTYQVASIG